MLEGDDRHPGGCDPPASEGVAEAIVGAGESLANWWLKHPDVARDDVAGWYVGPGPGGDHRRRPAPH